MIYTGCIPKIDETKYDEVWWIVRSPDKIPTIEKLVQELSPSKEVFKAYRKAFHLGIFDEEYFQTVYVPDFLDDLVKNQSALEKLGWLCEKSREKNIILGCYCEEEALCHRSIIAGILLGMGAKIETKQSISNILKKWSFWFEPKTPFLSFYQL